MFSSSLCFSKCHVNGEEISGDVLPSYTINMYLGTGSVEITNDCSKSGAFNVHKHTMIAVPIVVYMMLQNLT